jgi:hypothetical protein
MVNMPAEVRCTSSGALSIDGSASAKVSVSALVKPRKPAKTTIPTPCDVTMPISAASDAMPVGV